MCSANEGKGATGRNFFFFFFLTLSTSVHENICSQQKKKKPNTDTHDSSTPTGWNVEMLQGKVIVTLSREEITVLSYIGLRRKFFFRLTGLRSTRWRSNVCMFGRRARSGLGFALLFQGILFAGHSHLDKRNHAEPDFHQFKCTCCKRSDLKLSQKMYH